MDKSNWTQTDVAVGAGCVLYAAALVILILGIQFACQGGFR